MILLLTPDNKETFTAIRSNDELKNCIRRLDFVKPDMKDVAYIFAYYQVDGIVPITIDRECPSVLDCIKGKMELVLHDDTVARDALLLFYDNFLTAKGLILDLNMLIEPSHLGEVASTVSRPKVEAGRVDLSMLTLSVDTDTFRNDHTIEQVVCDDNLCTIHKCAFDCAVHLTSVKFNDRLSYIGDRAFADTALESVEFPKSMRVLGLSAFEGCTKLRELKLNDGLSVISAGAFQRCISLTNVVIPKSCKRIDDYAFSMCSLIRHYDLSEVDYIGDYCFYRNRSLVEITIPSSVNSLGAHAFDGCEELRCLHLPSSVPNLNENAFAGLSKECKIFVHADKNGNTPISINLYLHKIAFEVIKDG